jgi:DNA primase
VRKEIKKSWNPPLKLAGERQVYLNQVWRREAEAAVVVEGPADAISLGQWGMAALALCGLGGSDYGMEGVRRMVEKCKAVYVALDADAAGKGSSQAVASKLGPMVRLVDVGRLR